MPEPMIARDKPLSRRVCALALLAVVALSGIFTSIAHADGDPGSDVLVYQPLFLASDAGVSVTQQVQLAGLLRATNQAGFPVRVAIIASGSDLGAVTALWRKPRAYARFLGLELSLAYKQRLLVVMPNGVGFSWPGHSTASAYRLLANTPSSHGAGGLASAAQSAVRRLAAAAGIRVASRIPPARGAAPAARGSRDSGGAAARNIDNGAFMILAAVAALAAAALVARLALRRRGRAHPMVASDPPNVPQRASPRRLRRALPGFALLFAVAAGMPILALSDPAAPGEERALATNPNLDPGTRLSAPGPDFTLSDQFGQPVSLQSFRGKVVILAFNDSQCTTICPLTTTAMVDAKKRLGKAGSQVQLLGIDANPKATAIADVLSYSQVHGMLRTWRYLTGPLPQLKRVWKAYHIEAAIQQGLISHTPALFVIDPQGRLRKLYQTQQAYGALGQLGQLLAQEASRLLPGHPRVRSSLSYAQIPAISPGTRVALPRAGGGTARLGPDGAPHLFLFFATWDQQVTGLAGQLDALNQYQSAAAASGLPALTAVDEASVEPSPATLPGFLRSLPRPLAYPVATDQSGRVADGYQVHGEPWLVLTSPAGRILWYHEVSTSGWLTPSGLTQQVRAAWHAHLRLRRTPPPPPRSSRARHRRWQHCTPRRADCWAPSRRSLPGSARCAATRS